MKINVVIPTICKDLDILDDSINSLKRYIRKTHHKVFISLISIGKSFAVQSNIGASMVNSDLILFMNDDIIIKSDFIDSMVETMFKLDVHIVGCRLMYPNNTIQHIGVWFNEPNGCPYHKHIGDPYDPHNKEHKTGYRDAATAAFMLIKHDIFKSVDMFDEHYINGFEDVDLCCKVINKFGKNKIAIDAKPEVVHFESLSRGRDFECVKYNFYGIFKTKWKWNNKKHIWELNNEVHGK